MQAYNIYIHMYSYVCMYTHLQIQPGNQAFGGQEGELEFGQPNALHFWTHVGKKLVYSASCIPGLICVCMYVCMSVCMYACIHVKEAFA